MAHGEARDVREIAFTYLLALANKPINVSVERSHEHGRDDDHSKVHKHEIIVVHDLIESA